MSVVLALLAGCNRPVRTAGAEKLKPEQLALVRVQQHGGLTEWRGRPIHVETFHVGNAEYPISGDRDFLLPPGRHKLAVDYGLCPHDTGRAGAPPDDDDDDGGGIFTGPFGLMEAELRAGTAYGITADPTLVGRNAVQTRHGLREDRGR